MNEGFRLDQLFHSRPKGVFFLILLSWWQTIYFVLKTSVFYRGNYHCHMQFYCLSLVTTKQCGTNYCTTAPFNNKWTLKFKEAIVCRALWMARMDIVWNLKKMGLLFQVLILNAFKNHQPHWIEIYQSQTMTFTLLFSERSAKMTDSSLRASYPGHSGGWAGKGRRACNCVSSANFPVAPTHFPPITVKWKQVQM